MADIAEWGFPTRVVFGVGAAKLAGHEARALNASSALIISDPGVHGAGLTEQIEESLAQAGLKCAVHAAIDSNPTEQHVLDATHAFATAGADLVIGIGGGSPLDVAKLVRLAATHPLPLSQYDDANGGSARVVNALPPMIAIPTTAGTGSEVGRSGVVTIDQKKVVVFAPPLIPSVAILDPELTQTMPPAMTAATGMDALTHCVEAYCAVGDHPMADALALKGIALCNRSLLNAVNNGNDLQARGDLLKAAMMGAVAFQKGLGACHSLAHPLSTHHGMHHGLANAMCLPAVLEFNRDHAKDAIATIATALGAANPADCASSVRRLVDNVGLPSGLRDCGIEDDDIAVLSSLAIADGCHALNPRPCSQADMVALYQASM